MKQIFRGTSFNVQKGIAMYCERNHILNGVFLTRKYNSSDYRPLFECYINDKGNLILSKNEFRIYLKDDCYKKLYNNNRREARIVNRYIDIRNINENPLPLQSAIVDLKYPEIKEKIDNLRYRDNLHNDIESIYIRNQKIIITPKREIYYANGRKIRRVGNKELNWYKGSFIADSITIPNVYFFKFNDLTREILNYQYPRNLYHGDQYYINTHQLDDYYDAIKDYFPLVSYLRSNHQSNNINVLSDPNSLPTYIKKEFVDKNSKFEDDKLFGKVLIYNDNDFIDKNTGLLYGYNLCKTLNLQDVNVIKKFITFYKELSPYQYRNYYSVKNIRIYYKYLKEYYKGKVKNLELLLFNRIYFEKAQSNNQGDSMNMFSKAIKIRRKYPEKPFKKLDMEYLIKHSLNDIHDTLSIISRDDRLIENYQEFDMKNREKYEKEVNGYQFLMPENSSQLTRLADVMRNCVASYQGSILNKSSIIVYGTDNDDVIDYIKYGIGDIKDLTAKLEQDKILSPACIEINEYKKHASDYYFTFEQKLNDFVEGDLILRQCYARHNRHVDDENPNLDIACKEYFKNIGIAKYEARYNF